MKLFPLTIIVALTTTSLFINKAFAKKNSNEIKIIEIKRSLALNNNKQHNKEFYINAGSQQGIKKRHIVPVVRRKSFYDPLLNKSIGDLWVPVGELKVIYVGEKVSVARIHRVPERKVLPEVEYNTFMIGDRLKLNKARFYKPKKARKSARNQSSKNGRGIASVGKGGPLSTSEKYSFSKSLRDQMNSPTQSGGSAGRQYRIQAR